MLGALPTYEIGGRPARGRELVKPANSEKSRLASSTRRLPHCAGLPTEVDVAWASYFFAARLPAAMITSNAKATNAHQATLSVSFCHLRTSQMV